MIEITVTPEQRKAALSRALTGGGKARVWLTAGQARALAARAARQDSPVQPTEGDDVVADPVRGSP